ncbi:MAG: RNA-directed DNA polymerase [Candidatus Gastranaerophilales bacterium]|jgi:hypothetical protein|nr:RNA-directed DNA polymerase [Candidatus Gastranaerophilales bacterium]
MERVPLINLTKKSARNFFLESESYCSIDLPEYFNFKIWLTEISKFTAGFDISKAQEENTSYIIYNNKDGKYAWRKFQFIHPIVYLELVNKIIDNWEFIQKHFKANQVDKIHYCPIFKKESKHKKQKKTQILSYLEDIEKESIKKSLKFRYMSKLDITDCYSSVYTHSVAWALHTQQVAKNNRKNRFTLRGKKTDLPLIGNDVDFLLRAMQGGQTNGIPQGSILMDFIAEIILIYIDKLLGDKLFCEKIIEYEIVRYRDDYRIFTKEKNDNEKIIKILSEILIDFNFRLNTNKTEIGEDITLMSIKKDKLDNIIYHIGTDKEIDVYRLKRLLLDVLNISKIYPNSGFILKMLQHFNQRKFYNKNINWYKKQIDLLITILLDIVASNPRCFAVVCVSIFNLLPKLEKNKQKYFVDTIYRKLKGINNIGYNEIWLQRSLYKVDKSKGYEDKICNVVSGTQNESIFGNHFITDPQLKTLLDKNNFINKSKLSKMPKIPKESEVNIFANSDLI